jgi:pilus assembly protein TadC
MSDKRFASRRFSRSSSQSLNEQALAIERASSIVESDVSERELQRTIRQTLEKQELSEILIEMYVNRMFNIYRDHNNHDYNL